MNRDEYDIMAFFMFHSPCIFCGLKWNKHLLDEDDYNDLKKLLDFARRNPEVLEEYR